MHECPECGEACFCDIEDMPYEAPDDCEHDCEKDYIDEGDDYPEPFPPDENDDYDEGGEG